MSAVSLPMVFSWCYKSSSFCTHHNDSLVFDCRPWFFLQPGYWRPRRRHSPNLKRHRRHTARSESTSAEEGLVNGDAGETLDPDVAAEEARVSYLLQDYLLGVCSVLPMLCFAQMLAALHFLVTVELPPVN